MQPRPDPRRRAIIAYLEHTPAVSTFDPAHHRATKALARVGQARRFDTTTAETTTGKIQMYGQQSSVIMSL